MLEQNLERIKQINRCMDELATIRAKAGHIDPLMLLLAEMDWLEALHGYVHD